MRELLLIAAAGAAGAACRYGAGLWCQRVLGGHFPWGTLAVNVVGCFLMGLVIYTAEVTRTLPPQVAGPLAIGFLGALTTFSAFGIQTLHLWQSTQHGLALANIAANVLLGLLATWGGFALARTLSPPLL